jgi:hypothetical protein
METAYETTGAIFARNVVGKLNQLAVDEQLAHSPTSDQESAAPKACAREWHKGLPQGGALIGLRDKNLSANLFQMIIWVASYPRSGNSLTRQILRQCFGKVSYALRSGNGPSDRSDLLGTGTFEGKPEDFLRSARSDEKMWFVKTHLPSDVDEYEKVIYPFRDARAAMTSYRRFQHDVNGLDFTLEEIIRGRPPLENWSQHVAWALARPQQDTLLLRYEELRRPTPECLQLISIFTGLPIVTEKIASFEEIRHIRPEMTRNGDNGAGISDLESACSDLFWRENGEMMRRLGYP